MKKLITGSVLLLGVIFLAGCGQQQASSVENKKTEAIASNNSLEDLTKISTTIPADWKTYKDDKNGFEFKYPSSWIFTDNNAQIIEKRGQSSYDSYLSIKTSDYTSGDNITGALFLLTSMNQKTPQGVEIPVKECAGYVGLKLVDCPSNSDAKIIKVDNIISLIESKNNVIGVTLVKNNSTYLMSLMKSSQFLGGDDVFYQMLSTFKFLN